MYRVSLEKCLHVTANNIAMFWKSFGNINLHCVSGQIMVLIEIAYLHDPIFFTTCMFRLLPFCSGKCCSKLTFFFLGPALCIGLYRGTVQCHGTSVLFVSSFTGRPTGRIRAQAAFGL